MTGDGQQLKEALIQSLREKPLLVGTERELLSLYDTAQLDELRGSLANMLSSGSTLVEADELSFQGTESDFAKGFRSGMELALNGGSRLTDADRDVLSSFGFEKLSEFRSTLYADLGGPAEIPKQDLAIYVPTDDERVHAFKEALEKQLRTLPEEWDAQAQGIDEALAIPESFSEIEEQLNVHLPLAEEELLLWEAPPVKPSEALEQPPIIEPPVETPAPETIPLPTTLPIAPDRVPGETAATTVIDLQGLNPVPRMAAALEAAGYEEQDFGFILRYGRYAPDGRKSDFLVGGLGLAELSDRLTSWLARQGPMEEQVQVVDDGSGEVTIYLLNPEDV
jgi:hypothetical protein